MWESILGAVAGPILGGLFGSDAAENAADAQLQAANYAAQQQREMFDKQVELNAPFREAGLTAQNQLLNYLGLGTNKTAPGFGKYAGDFSMNDFQADPGYAFRLSEGMKAMNNSAAARGGLISGNALKAAQNYGQNAASQEYQNAFNRYQVNRSNQINPLQSLMGGGQTATNTLSNAAGTLGSGLAENTLGAGNARASGYVGQANALSNALSQGYNNYRSNQFLGMLGNNSRSTPSFTGDTSGGSLWDMLGTNYLGE